MENIVTRPTVQRTVSPSVSDTRNNKINLGLEQPLKAASSFLSAQEKAQDNANKLRLTQYKIDRDRIINENRGKLAESEGMNALTANTETRNNAEKGLAKILEKLPESLRRQGKMENDRGIINFDKFAANHTNIQSDKARDSIYKTRHKNIAQNAILASPNSDAFQAMLGDLDISMADYAEQRGLDKSTSNFLAATEKSNIVVESLRQRQTLGDLQGAKSFYKQYKTLLSGTDNTKALDIIDKAAEENKNTLAKALVSQAFEAFPNDASGRLKFIAREKDGDVYRAAQTMYNSQESARRGAESEQRLDKKGKAFEAIRKAGVITPGILNSVDPIDRKDLLEFTTKVSQNKFVQTDWETYKSLDKMYAEEPMKFQKTNFRAFADKLNDRELQELEGRKEILINKNRGRKESVQFSTSQRVNPIMNGILISRNLDPAGDEYQSFKSVGRRIYMETVAAMAEETDPKKIELEFEKRFRRATLPQELVGGFLGYFRKLDEVTIEEAQERISAGDNLVDIDNADPAKMEKMRKLFQAKRGREITDKELQDWLNNDARKKLRIE